MIITAVADLHGHLPNLPGGDVLIVAGDLTAKDRDGEYHAFIFWLSSQYYTTKIVVGGNHDNLLETREVEIEHPICKNIHYLQNSGIEINGIKFWGFPYTSKFTGINPACCAFTVDSDIDLQDKVNLIPTDIDVLISHGPPKYILDQSRDGYNCGSVVLRQHIDKCLPRYFLCGHIHEQGGMTLLLKGAGPNTTCMNVSYVDENYEPREEIRTFELTL